MVKVLNNYTEMNLNKFWNNYFVISDQINRLELDTIDLLQPMGDTISLNRELERLNEIISTYMVSRENK